MDTREATTTLVQCFESLAPERVEDLLRLYHPQARFKDPFNDVQGHAAIAQVFHHMYRSLEAPHFVVTRQLVDGAEAFLTWDFRFHFRGVGGPGMQTVRGATHLVFDAQGLVTLHRDYWDVAEELYEKLPVLGSLMRWLKSRARH